MQVTRYMQESNTYRTWHTIKELYITGYPGSRVAQPQSKEGRFSEYTHYALNSNYVWIFGKLGSARRLSTGSLKKDL